MNGSLFVNGLTIDWNQIDPDSYLHEITALHGIHSLSFGYVFCGREWDGEIHAAGGHCVGLRHESGGREQGLSVLHQRYPFGSV